MHRFDLIGALARGRAHEAAAGAPDLEAVLAGAWTCERAEIGGVPVLVRATSLSETESARAEALLAAQLLGSADAIVIDEIAMRLELAKAVVDGTRGPIFTESELADLPRPMLERLDVAHLKAQARIYPLLEERDARAFMRAIGVRAGSPRHNGDRIRARHTNPSAFFRVAPIELTAWQLLFFEALTRT